MTQFKDKLNMQNLDPRVIRTRRLLLDSFDSLRKEKESLRSLSVRDITERAGVNRVTFYAHFIDKYELLDTWKRDMFRKAYKTYAPINPESDLSAIETLINVVFDFMTTYNGSKKPTNKQFEPLLEAAIQQEAKIALLHILESNKAYKQTTTLDTTATYLSWAIFGSANDWSLHKPAIKKQEMVTQILELVENTFNQS